MTKDKAIVRDNNNNIVLELNGISTSDPNEFSNILDRTNDTTDFIIEYNGNRWNKDKEIVQSINIDKITFQTGGWAFVTRTITKILYDLELNICDINVK